MTTDTHNIDIRGTYTDPNGAGPGVPARVVFQRTAPGAGNLPGNGTYNQQRRAWVRPRDVCSAAQWRRRSIMRAAAAAYATGAPIYASRAAEIATQRSLTRQQAYAAAFAAGQVPPGAPIWDATLSVWDDAGTVWDGAGCRWDAIDLTTWDSLATVWTA